MAQSVTSLEQFIAEFRDTLPAQSATARAIDANAPFAQVVFRAIEDGYTEFAERLSGFVEAFLRRSV